MRGNRREERQSALDKFRKKREEQQAKRSGKYCVTPPEGVSFVEQKKAGDRYFKLIGYVVKDPKHPDAEVGDVIFRRPYGKHKNLGPENSDAVCLNYPSGKKCPPCEQRELARARKDDKKVVEAFNRSTRTLCLVVDIEEKEPKLELLEGPDSMGKAPGFGRMLEDEIIRLDAASPAPWEMEGPIMEVRFGEDTWDGRPFYPITKLNLIDQDDKRKLPRGAHLDFSAFSPEDVPCLDECLNILSYDALERLMMGVDEEEDRGRSTREAEEEPPRSSRQRPREEPEEEPEPPPAERDEPTKERIEKALEEIADADHDDLAAFFEEFGVEPDRDDLKASKKGDKNARKALRKELRAALEEMLEEGGPEPEPPKPAKTGGRGSKPTAQPPKPAPAAAGECPHGHEWGEDTDDKPECKTCDAWGGCADEQDERKKATQKK